MKSLPKNSVDGIFTDPPWGGAIKIKGQKRWKELISEMTTQAARVLKPGGRCLIWVGSRMVGDTILSVRKLEYKYLFLCKFIPPRYIGCYFADHDAILYFSKPGEKMYYRKGKYIPQAFIKPSRGKNDTKHPCARPIDIVRKLLFHFSNPGEYWLDPFAGSDTVGVSCRELKLKFDTCEIDPIMHKHGKARHSQGFLWEKI